MRKTTAVRTRRHVARLGAPYGAQIKFTFPCDERSGKVFTDTVNGIQVSPAQGNYTGSLAFTDSYGITVTNDAAEPYTPILTGAWPALNTAKVLIMAAVVKCTDNTKAKFPIGDAFFGPGLTLSFAAGMHALIQSDAGTLIQTTYDVTKTLTNGTEYIIYVQWDPFTAGGTLTGRVLDSAGTQVYVQTATGALTGMLTATPVTRITGMTVYSWTCYELDAVPTNLVTGLRWMHDLHTTSLTDKGPYIF